MSGNMECHMSVALLESSALQSLILQSLMSMHHDSSETIFGVHGILVSSRYKHVLNTNGSSSLQWGANSR